MPAAFKVLPTVRSPRSSSSLIISISIRILVCRLIFRFQTKRLAHLFSVLFAAVYSVPTFSSRIVHSSGSIDSLFPFHWFPGAPEAKSLAFPLRSIPPPDPRISTICSQQLWRLSAFERHIIWSGNKYWPPSTSFKCISCPVTLACCMSQLSFTLSTLLNVSNLCRSFFLRSIEVIRPWKGSSSFSADSSPPLVFVDHGLVLPPAIPPPR